MAIDTFAESAVNGSNNGGLSAPGKDSGMRPSPPEPQFAEPPSRSQPTAAPAAARQPASPPAPTAQPQPQRQTGTPPSSQPAHNAPAPTPLAGSAATATNPPSEPQFAPHLLAWAQLTEQQARETFVNPSGLEAAHRLSEQAINRQYLHPAGQGAAPQPPAPQSTPQQTSGGQPAEFEFKPFELPPAQDGDVWPDETRKFASSLNDHFRTQVEQLHQVAQGQIDQQAGHIKTLVDHLRGENARSITEQLDEEIAALDPAWSAIFGTGPTSTLPQHGFELNNRRLMAETMSRIENGRANANQPYYTRPMLFGASLAESFASQKYHIDQQAMSRDVQQQVEDRESQFSNPPAHAPPAPADTREQALDNIEKWYYDRGINTASPGSMQGQAP